MNRKSVNNTGESIVEKNQHILTTFVNVTRVTSVHPMPVSINQERLSESQTMVQHDCKNRQHSNGKPGWGPD